MASTWSHKSTSVSFELTTSPFVVTILYASSFQEEGTYGMSSNVSFIWMIHAQISSIFLQNIISSSWVGCYSIFRENLSCIRIQHRIWSSVSKPLGFRVGARISFVLRSNMQVIVSKLTLFEIVSTRTLSFISMMCWDVWRHWQERRC